MIITKRISVTRIILGTWKNLLLLILVCIITYFVNLYFLKNYFELPLIIPTILGSALAFFIGFNNNQAYDRWWEARKIWGSLVNDSRTWTRLLINNTSADNPEEKNELRMIRRRSIYRHIAFLYALKENLRKENKKAYKKFLLPKEFNKVELESNIHNAILNLQSKDLEYLNKKGWIDGFRFIEMNKVIVNFCNSMGMSERIKNTVFPTTYIFYTRIFIWFLILSIILVTTDPVGYGAIIIGVFVGYVFLVTHIIGISILNPFEPTPAGISLDQITRTIEINLLEALGEKDVPKPIQNINNEYIM